MFIAQEQELWWDTLKPGDKVIYKISQTFDWDLHYFEDMVKERINKNTIITEAGLKFIDYWCIRNSRVLIIENPENDYRDGENTKDHHFYQISKFKGKVTSINDWQPIQKIHSAEEQLNAAIKRTWVNNQKSTFGSFEIEDAYLEKKYRSDNNKIDYFNTLTNCVGMGVVNGSLIDLVSDTVVAKKCSFKIGTYLVYRKLINEKKKDEWEESLIYVYNTKTNEFKQDSLGFITNTRYWLEMECKDEYPDHTSSLLSFPLINIAHKINVYKGKFKKKQ